MVFMPSIVCFWRDFRVVGRMSNGHFHPDVSLALAWFSCLRFLWETG